MRIAVVGAGVAGLTAAFRLQQRGHRVEVFESAGHPGGRMWSETVAGFPLDLGVHMLLAHYDRTRALMAELGLEDRWYEPEGGAGGILHDQRLEHFSPRRAFDVLRFRGIRPAARVRLFLELARAMALRDDLDFFDLSVGGDDFDQEDCESFARRRMGDEATDYVVDSFIRTFHFHGAERMSAKYFEALAALLLKRGEFRVYALRGHMGVLPAALASRLSVRYGSAVTEVTPGTDGEPCGVVLDGAPTASRHDAVVVATTAGVARGLLPRSSPAQHELLAHTASSCTLVCSFSVPVRVAGDFEGIWVPFVESTIVCALSNETCKGATDGQRSALSVFLHEEAALPWIARPDREVSDAVAAELVRLFPRYAGSLKPLHVQRWPEALPVYAPGHVSRVKAFWARGQGDGGVWLCGDYLNHPWVEGAVRCGEKVASRLDAASG